MTPFVTGHVCAEYSSYRPAAPITKSVNPNTEQNRANINKAMRRMTNGLTSYSGAESSGLLQIVRTRLNRFQILNDIEIIQYGSLYHQTIIRTESTSAMRRFLEGLLVAVTCPFLFERSLGC